MRVVGDGPGDGRDVSELRQQQEAFCASAWTTLVPALAHYCGDVHLAEEVVQEALVKACRRWRRVSELDSAVGWTYRVAVNVCNSRLRRRGAEQRAYARHGSPDGAHHDEDVADKVAVREALASLTSRQREAVVLRYFLDLPVERSAELMGASPGAVRALTHRAIVRLGEVLDVQITVDEEAADVS